MNDYFTLNDVQQVLMGKPVVITKAQMARVETCYRFLEHFANDKIIYGINTGFGPMAQYRVSDGNLKALQYNIIRSHAVGAGQPLPSECVKTAMLARLVSLLQGKSGVHPDLVLLLVEFINRDICPYVPEHGSVGASGDLVQLAHIALALIGEGEVFYGGKLCPTAVVLKECGLKAIEMHIREGLSVTNGTSVMTGIGLVNLLNAKKLLRLAIAASVMVNEVVASFDDMMSIPLNQAKLHRGQREVAAAMRRYATDNKRLQKREAVLYAAQHDECIFHQKIQPYYSLRCVPQVLGPVWDTLAGCEQILLDELNSACDNPMIDVQTQNVYHGGNFHGDYVSFEMDKLKIAVTKLTMLMERQLNYLCHDRINNLLPPFVNMGVLGLNYGVQAMQFTATSTTAECQTLSNPMCVHSIPNNNDNQDIVSMGTNAALITRHVIENAFQVIAIHFVAIMQAVDCLKIADALAPASRRLYDDVRHLVPTFTDDQPKYHELAALKEFLHLNTPTEL